MMGAWGVEGAPLQRIFTALRTLPRFSVRAGKHRLVIKGENTAGFFVSLCIEEGIEPVVRCKFNQKSDNPIPNPVIRKSENSQERQSR